MKNIYSLIISLMLILLLLTACVDNSANSLETDVDNPSIILPMETGSETAPNSALLPTESNIENEYVLFTIAYGEDGYNYAILGKDTLSFEEGKGCFDTFLEKYAKGNTELFIQSITTDGKFVVFAEYPNDNDCIIKVYEEQNIIFTNTVDSDSYVLSEMNYDIDPDDYATALTSILRSSYGFSSYPAATATIDIVSTIGHLPVAVSDDCTAYLISKWDAEAKMIAFSIFSYPDHELISTLKFPHSEDVSFSEDIIINHFVDKQCIVYTIWDTETTYLLDTTSNTAAELGQEMWYARLSPDGKYLAYVSRSRESSSTDGIRILDLDNNEIYHYEIGKNYYPGIFGWVQNPHIASN